MAYLAFDAIGAHPAPRGPIPATPAQAPQHDVTDAARLSALEWSVVALSRRDPLSSLRAPGRVALAMRTVLRQTNLRLADERLEALRRLAVMSWHYSFKVPASEIARFLAAGFTKPQYEAVTASIAAARIAERRR